jgi:hypothetical protein
MGVSGLDAPRHLIAHRMAVTRASIRHAGIPISTRRAQYDALCGIAASLKSNAGWWQVAVSPFPMKIILPRRASNMNEKSSVHFRDLGVCHSPCVPAER